MLTVSAGGLENRCADLETSASLALGRLLFEFSRLDMALGLCVVWVGRGKRIPELTNRFSSSSFHQKLEFLRGVVRSTLAASEGDRQAYEQWAIEADALREKRNDLVHGRWGIDAVNDRVFNVTGLPTSSAQREVPYTVDELLSVVAQTRLLNQQLHLLRRRCPL